MEFTLGNKAKDAADKAYCSYSDFRVGAAIFTKKKNTFTGCNVENASYGLTNCAERTAIFKAVSEEGPDMRIDHLVIYTPTDTVTGPCGACRQVINEFGPDAKITIICDSDDVLETTLDKLLPESFGPHNLE